MSIDVAAAIGRSLTPDAVNRVSLLIGETPDTTRRALDTAVPTALAGLIGLASSAPGAAELARWLDGHAGVREAARNPASLVEGGEVTQRALEAGQDLLARLFGERLRAVAQLVARTSDVSATSGVLLLSLAGVLALGALGREASRGGAGTGDLASLLGAQRAAVADLAPPGLADAMGVSSVAGVGAAPLPAPAAPRPRTPLAWVLPILLAVVVIGAVAAYIKG